MPRPQFTLRALLVAMLVVGAFLGGMQLEWQIVKRQGLWRQVHPQPGIDTYPLVIPLDAPVPDGYQEHEPVRAASSAAQ